MPLSLLETLAVGTPAVVYDIRYGPREIVRDGVDGFVVLGKDVPAAAAAVVRPLTEPGLRDQMSHSAREVTARFVWTGSRRVVAIWKRLAFNAHAWTRSTSANGWGPNAPIAFLALPRRRTGGRMQDKARGFVLSTTETVLVAVASSAAAVDHVLLWQRRQWWGGWLP